MAAMRIGILAALLAAAPAQAGEQPPLAEARRLLDAAEGPGDLARAVEVLEAARRPQGSLEVLTLLAHAYYRRGYATEDRDRAVEDFEAAIRAAEGALAQAPGHIPARYWRAVAMLQKAGRLRGAESFGLVRRAVQELQVVAAADPEMDSAGAHRAMGKVYLDSPWWFLGDTEKAIEQLEAARKLAPHSLQNRRYLAEAYAEDGREADALRELEDLLRMPRVPGRAAAEQKERDLARRLAERLRARLKRP